MEMVGGLCKFYCLCANSSLRFSKILDLCSAIFSDNGFLSTGTKVPYFFATISDFSRAKEILLLYEWTLQ